MTAEHWLIGAGHRPQPRRLDWTVRGSIFCASYWANLTAIVELYPRLSPSSNDAVTAEASHLFHAQAKTLTQYLLGVLAEKRRRTR